MPSKPIPIPFPLQGISDNTAYTDQPPGTTREALNCRMINPKNGRTMPSQRSGLGLYDSDGTQINGANIVQDIISVSKNEDLLTWADDNSGGEPTNIFGKALPGPTAVAGDGDAVDMQMDAYGDVYVAQRVTGVYKYNQDGEKLAEILVPEATAPALGRIEIAAFDIDEFGNAVIVTGGPGSSVPAICRMHMFEAQLDGTYRNVWNLDTGRAFSDVRFYQGDIYAIESTAIPNNTGCVSYFTVYRNYTLTEAPVEDADVRVDLSGSTGIGNSYGTRMAVREDGVAYVTGCDTGSAANTVSTFLLKLNPNGDTPTSPVWDIINSAAATFPDDFSGMGYGVTMGPRNSSGEWTIYTYGPQGNSGTDNGEARRVTDKQTSWASAWVSSVTTAPSANPANHKFNRIDTDKDGHLYICPPTTSGKTVEILNEADGTALRSFTESTADSLATGGCAIAVSKGDKPKGSSSEEVEFVFYGMRQSAATLAFYKQRMVAATQGSGAMRSQVQLAVSNGNIVKFTDTTISDPAGGTGVGKIDTAAPHVMSVTFGEEVFWVDGVNNVKYSVEDDAVSDWLSKTSQPIPRRCRLIETWRGRVVLGRDPEDPQLWHMSAVGNPYDWDNFPAVATVTQAISGTNAKAGKVPDIVNAIIPWDDDLCLFGGDRSIWRLTGDPLAGGQFDLVSDETGIAFGRCWTKDPVGGRLFFAGSRGGIYMMERNSLPVRISRDWIERRLQDDIDFSQYFLRLVWNYRDEGLHVFQCPFAGNEGTVVKHWFWDSKNGGWWEDQFGDALNTEPQPCSVFVLDGDQASDRRLLIGGEDGRIRVWNENKLHDELTASTNQPIKWKLVLGPLLPSNIDREFRFRRFTAVLARDTNGCAYRFYAPDEADTLGAVLHSGQLRPGRNTSAQARFRGPNAYLQLSNMQTSSRTAIESLLIHAAPCGRVRSRQ